MVVNKTFDWGGKDQYIKGYFVYRAFWFFNLNIIYYQKLDQGAECWGPDASLHTKIGQIE